MGGTESDSRSEHSVTIEDRSCDLVIMNPPFTRPTNHEAGHAEIPVPSFAGFSTSHDEQQEMGRKLKKATGPFGSGNAGLASNFMDLGHSKLKDGGVLALVIPFAFVRGKSWKGAREALRAHYTDVHVTSIAAYRLDGAGILGRHRHGRVPGRGDETRRGQVRRVVFQFGGKALVAPGSRRGSEERKGPCCAGRHP